MYVFKRKGEISTFNGKPLTEDYFTNLGSNVSSIESDVNISLAKAWNEIDKLSIIWKSNKSDKIKRECYVLS